MTVRRTAALAALGLAALLAVMDGTVVAVALGPLAREFDTSLSTAVWLTVGYLLAAATTLPTLAWLTARFGGRAAFLAGLGIFVLGSALCAVAPSISALIAFRVVQGLGGGLLEPAALALAAALAGPSEVGRVLGSMSAVINVAPVLGPVVGAALATTGHWRWIFIVNLPLGLLVLVAALAFVPGRRPVAAAPATADVRGLALLTAGYVCLLFALNRAGEPGVRWPSAVTAVTGLVLLLAFVRHALSGRTAAPAFDLRLLRHRGFAAALAVMALVGFVNYSLVAALPILGAQRYDLDGAAQGLLVCALGAGLMVSMTTGGRLSDRLGTRRVVRAGAVATLVLFALVTLTHGALALPAALVTFVLIGLAFGATASPTFASVYRVLPATEQATGTVGIFMALQLAASLGVTVLGGLTSSTWFTTLLVLLTAAAAGILVLSRHLGRTDAVPALVHRSGG